jgi:hypothetical protein
VALIAGVVWTAVVAIEDELVAVVLEVVETVEVTKLDDALGFVEELLVVEELLTALNEYTLNPFDPPHISFVFPLQVITHSVFAFGEGPVSYLIELSQ